MIKHPAEILSSIDVDKPITTRIAAAWWAHILDEVLTREWSPHGTHAALVNLRARFQMIAEAPAAPSEHGRAMGDPPRPFTPAAGVGEIPGIEVGTPKEPAAVAAPAFRAPHVPRFPDADR